jgi:uncharacterized membrane protein
VAAHRPQQQHLPQMAHQPHRLPQEMRQRPRPALQVVRLLALVIELSMNLKKYIFAGLLVWLPLAITLWVLSWLVGVLDGIFANVLQGLGNLLPQAFNDSFAHLQNIRGLGVVLVFLVLVLTGALASNVFGNWLVKQWDKLFTHIPIVKSIYTSVKKVSDTLFSSNGNAFRKALLIQYPRQGAWTIAFQTGAPSGEVSQHLGEGFISVYVPTTPNPTSGFFLLVPSKDIVELDMSVDEALTYVISMGAVSPTNASPHSTP